MAAFPVASGQPQLSGGYIPRLYAKQMLAVFYATTTFGAIANTDYQGEVANMGDTVRIREVPTITISDYVKGQTLSYENPAPTDIDLELNKGKYWAVNLNDVDLKQSDLAFGQAWADDGAQRLKIQVDTDVLANVYGDVHASNAGATAGAISGDINLGVSGTSLQLTSTNVLDTIVNCNTVLDEQNVPEQGRYLVLPAWAVGLIKQSDLKDASLAGDGTSILRNGRVGMIDRTEIFMSNLINSGASGSDTAWDCIFGHKVGLTFAAQMTKTETLRNPQDFGDIMRSLMVYGYKVTKPEAIGHLHIKK